MLIGDIEVDPIGLAFFYVIVAVGFAVACGFLGYFVGKAKGNEGFGALLGTILGPLGILIAALLPDSTNKRPRDPPPDDRMREYTGKPAPDVPDEWLKP